VNGPNILEEQWMAFEGKSSTEFLNIDLDLRAPSGLEDLLRFLEPSVLVMRQAAQEASIELNAEASSLEGTLVLWIELIQSLPEPVRAIWDQCEVRSMNIGIQGGIEPHAAYFTIPSETVRQLATLQIEIALTVYAASTA
jgi:hypothetical protein